MAGSSAERQETGVVQAILRAITTNKRRPIRVEAGGTTLSAITKAQKYHGRQVSGSEPYTDVQLFQDGKGNSTINLSLKGEAAPSLAGGGLRGLEAIIPGITARFMKAALKALLKEGYKAGDKIPDIFGKIDPKDKIKIVVGTSAMGGPIHYMYIGPMEVKSKYNPQNNTLTLNGNLIEAKYYAKTHELYFRFRARREDQRFDPDAEQGGVPKIYGKSPSKGDSAGRIVVTDKPSGQGLIVKF